MSDYETNIALREGNAIESESAYFCARPGLDSQGTRKVFADAFERGWEARRKETDRLRAQLAEAQKLVELVTAERNQYRDAMHVSQGLKGSADFELAELRRQLTEARRQIEAMQKGEPVAKVDEDVNGMPFIVECSPLSPKMIGERLFLAAPKLPEGVEKDAARYRLLRDPMKQPIDPDNMLLVGAPAGDDIVEGHVLDCMLDAMLNAAPNLQEGHPHESD